MKKCLQMKSIGLIQKARTINLVMNCISLRVGFILRANLGNNIFIFLIAFLSSKFLIFSKRSKCSFKSSLLIHNTPKFLDALHTKNLHLLKFLNVLKVLIDPCLRALVDHKHKVLCILKDDTKSKSYFHH